MLLYCVRQRAAEANWRLILIWTTSTVKTHSRSDRLMEPHKHAFRMPACLFGLSGECGSHSKKNKQTCVISQFRPLTNAIQHFVIPYCVEKFLDLKLFIEMCSLFICRNPSPQTVVIQSLTSNHNLPSMSLWEKRYLPFIYWACVALSVNTAAFHLSVLNRYSIFDPTILLRPSFGGHGRLVYFCVTECGESDPIARLLRETIRSWRWRDNRSVW